MILKIFQQNNGVNQMKIQDIRFVSIVLLGIGILSCTNSTESNQISLSLQLHPSHVSSFGGSDGSVDLTVSGGTKPYHFQWSNGDTTEDINNLIAGNYTVNVLD